MTDAQVLEDRALEYGDATKSFTAIANLWSQYLDIKIEPTQVAMMMTLLKIQRSKTAKNFHYFDSLQDARNYLTLAEQIKKQELSEDDI